MNHAVVEKKLRKLRILVAPLDWGLGHATRCIPIIRELLAQGAEPWIAAEGAQEVLLKTEFPDLPFLPLKGYRVKYASSAPGLLRQMIVQSPRLLSTIKNENRWLRNAVLQHSLDAVISDNRFGLSHPAIPTIFISHQLSIKSPLGRWSERLLQKMNYRYINRFTECWIPDHSSKASLAGALSHPVRMPSIPVYYTGPLSRLHAINSIEEKDHLLFILSGPEPQRTILENKVIRDIAHYNGSACIIRGLPGHSQMIPSTNMIRIYNHLPTHELEQEIAKAAFVISRSGYSTVMDIAALHKKSILIPTPGQTEQEYLADYLLKKHFAFCTDQKDFSLQTVLPKARHFNYKLPDAHNESLLHPHISRLIQSIYAS